MCGIVGYYVYENHPRYEDDLEKALLTLHHRGPDHQSFLTQGQSGLGHTRLSILDLSPSAHQPMQSFNQRYIISFNGQVYNYIEIAKTLKTTLVVHSDTRVILEAISELGLETAASLFNGMFAFALLDKETDQLHLVRDSMGIKPLYWSKTNDGYLFGSEIKALKSFSDFNSTLSFKGVESYLRNKAVYSPHSIYEDCYKLLPGHILTFPTVRNRSMSEAKDSHPTLTSFTALDTPYSRQLRPSRIRSSFPGRSSSDIHSYGTIKTLQAADECFEEVMKGSIKRHTRSDVPFSVFLSGGIDSSLIVSLLSQSHRIKTYSIGYEEKAFDESVKAKKIADALSVEHTAFILSPDTVFKAIQKIPMLYDEPFADSSCLPTYLLSQEVSKVTKVAFSGDGADEIFGGYPRYFNAIQQWNRIKKIPYPIRHFFSKNILRQDSKIIHFLTRFFVKSPQQSLPYIRKIFSYKSIEELFYNDNALSLPSSALSSLSKNVFSQKKCTENHKNSSFSKDMNKTALKTLLHYDQRWRLPDEMLTKVDRASMANSLEIRVPFLDNEVVTFSRALTDNFLGTPHTQKILLRRLLSKYIPPHLVEGPKMGFHIPMKLWLKSHYKEWAKNILFDTHTELELFDKEELRKIWNLYSEGDDHLFYPLWSAIMYYQWAKHFNM